MNKQIIFATMACWLAILPGCSHQPTFGDQMIEQSYSTKELGKQWIAGNEMRKEGEKLVNQGKEIIEEAREDIRQGEEKISEGKKLIEQGNQQMKANERMYKKHYPAPNNT